MEKNLDLGVQKLSGIRLDAQLDGKVIRIAPLRVDVVSGKTVEASGWVSPFEKSYQINLTSKGIALQHIDKIREQGIAEGNIRLNLSGKGTFGNPQVEGDIALSDLRIREKPLDDIQLHISLRDQLAKVSGKLNFDVDGSYHIQKKDFSAALLFDKTDLEPYLKLANQNDLTGSLSGRIKADGNAGAIDRIQAATDLSDLKLFFKGNEMVSSQDFKASFRNGEISLPGVFLRLLKDGHLKLDGKGNPKGPFDFQVNGDIPLSVISPFAKDIPDISGRLSINADIKGSPSEPELRADLELEKVGMTIPVLMQQLHDVNGKIRITPESAKIERFNGQLDNGRIDLSGSVGLKKFVPTRMDVKLKADALPVRVPDTLDILLNTDLQIRGTMEKSALTGEAVILEGTYYKDVNISFISGLKNAVKKKRETAPQTSKPPNPFLKKYEP